MTHLIAPKVPFGPQSIAGYSFSLAAFVAAVLAFIEGDRSEATVGTIVFGVASLVAVVLTNRNRTEQAKTLAQIAARERTAPVARLTTLPEPVAFSGNSVALGTPVRVEAELDGPAPAGLSEAYDDYIAETEGIGDAETLSEPRVPDKGDQLAAEAVVNDPDGDGD